MKIRNVLEKEIKDLPWIFIGILLLLRVGIAEANWVPTGSMQPTLPIGDYVVVDRTAYGLSLPFIDEAVMQWDAPKQGEIVTFDPQHTEDRLIKRVIGVAGDEIMVRNGLTYLNGNPLGQRRVDGLVAESLNGIHYLTTPAQIDFGPVTVPQGHLFMMGDNRANSADSRYWGFLPVDRVRGKAQFRLFTTAWFKQNQYPATFGNLYN